MSADNAIFVQKRLDGNWWVWMDFMSEDTHCPDEVSDYSTNTEEKAMAYANGWLRGEDIVEYGICHLAPEQEQPRQDQPVSIPLLERLRLGDAILATIAEHFFPDEVFSEEELCDWAAAHYSTRPQEYLSPETLAKLASQEWVALQLEDDGQPSPTED